MDHLGATSGRPAAAKAAAMGMLRMRMAHEGRRGPGTDRGMAEAGLATTAVCVDGWMVDDMGRA